MASNERRSWCTPFLLVEKPRGAKREGPSLQSRFVATAFACKSSLPLFSRSNSMDIDSGPSGPSYFESFAEIVRSFRPDVRPGRLDKDALLSPEEGFPARFEELCGLFFRDEADMTEEERLAWKLESDTWLLIKELYLYRLQVDRDEIQSMEELLQINPYTTPAELAGALLSSPTLHELDLVRNWLGATAPEPEDLPYRKGYWPNTTMRENQRTRVGGPKGPGMDPDATLRGLVMEGDDAAFDRSLMRHVFQCIRANDSERALETCREAAQPWRAASLIGGKAYTTFSLSNYKGMDMEIPTGGNRHRMLWKKTCYKLASTPSLDQYERAVYGAMVGDVKSIKEVCKSWEDHLWARVHGRLEQAVDAGLLESDSWWMKKGGIANDMPLEGLERVTDNMDVLFEEVEHEESVGGESLHPFRITQKHIILNAVENLLRDFDERLAMNALPESEPLRNHLICFFAHLALFLRWSEAVGPDMRPTEANILQEYCNTLERMNELDLVALYAGVIGEVRDPNITDGDTSYAQFLKRMNNAPTERRAEALRRTTQNGLSYTIVAVRTVDSIFGELIHSASTSFDDPEPSFTALDQSLSQAEGSLINAVDWLLFDKSTFGPALTHANALLRWFLLNGRLHAATQLVKRLPLDIQRPQREGAPIDYESAEQFQLRNFVGCLEALERCKHFEDRTNLAKSRLAKADRQRSYSSAVSDARDLTLDILTMRWLEVLKDDPALPERPRQVRRLRQLYIPELVMRLHRVLYQARDEVSEALRWTFDLSNTVADGRYELAETFLTGDHESNKLIGYLAGMRDVGMNVLQRGATDPFSVMHR
ncbi:nuclear pore protein 84/107 [Calocera cornea HHB12733]|uniref:Nuclear pore complex protein n=1 Tax=Calocera cornea HHB12733 TaxID=1353952 RepID=A0A165D3D4_9BASI|nr:nuclear pore protein 84/107 [Calocera cornea HHB12733]